MNRTTIMPARDAYAGIDVTFAKGKRLPVAVCIMENGRLTPLQLRRRKDLLPPAGRGNRYTLDSTSVNAFAEAALAYLTALEDSENVRIKTVAIDASRTYTPENLQRRACEAGLDQRRIRYYLTPRESEFRRIVQQARKHLAGGGAEQKLPHAHRLWMLVGFALFKTLERRYDCLEVFPQAIVHVLGQAGIHKTRATGLANQLAAIAAQTGWSASELDERLATIGYGAKHDRLDAYMAAWVASLPADRREACGTPPNDVIWLPKIE